MKPAAMGVTSFTGTGAASEGGDDASVGGVKEVGHEKPGRPLLAGVGDP